MKNLPLEIQLEGKKKNFANLSVQQVHTKALCEQQKRAKSSTPDSNQNEKLNESVLWEVQLQKSWRWTAEIQHGSHLVRFNRMEASASGWNRVFSESC